MKALLVCVLVLLGGIPSASVRAEIPTGKVLTSEKFRQHLLEAKWWWENIQAPADRECVFMPDGTFRHPRFVAKFVITGPREVVLTRKGAHGAEKATLTFNADYTRFEAIDFGGKGRITGRRDGVK